MFFLNRERELVNPREIEHLKPSENPLCDNVMDGKLNLALVNSGNFVTIEKII